MVLVIGNYIHGVNVIKVSLYSQVNSIYLQDHKIISGQFRTSVTCYDINKPTWKAKGYLESSFLCMHC